MTLATDDRITQ